MHGTVVDVEHPHVGEVLLKPLIDAAELRQEGLGVLVLIELVRHTYGHAHDVQSPLGPDAVAVHQIAIRCDAALLDIAVLIIINKAIAGLLPARRGRHRETQCHKHRRCGCQHFLLFHGFSS